MIVSTLLYNKYSEKVIEGLERTFEESSEKAAEEALLFAEAKAKLIFRGPITAPVHKTILTARTGHLRRSIRSGVYKTKGWIGTKVSYGLYHEEGTKHLPPRPFLSPSFEGKNLEKIVEIIERNVIEGFDKQ